MRYYVILLSNIYKYGKLKYNSPCKFLIAKYSFSSYHQKSHSILIRAFAQNIKMFANDHVILFFYLNAKRMQLYLSDGLFSITISIEQQIFLFGGSVISSCWDFVVKNIFSDCQGGFLKHCNCCFKFVRFTSKSKVI